MGRFLIFNPQRPTFRICTAIAGAACSLLAGCNVGPDYHQPKVALPAQWSRGVATTQPATHPSTQAATPPGAPGAGAGVNLARWWTAFHDPELERLVARALAANLDLKIAQERLREARASRQISQSNELPTAETTGSYQRVRISQSVLPMLGGASTSGGATGTGAAAGAGNPASSLFFPVETDLYTAGFDASWEVDIFGRNRRGVEAAKAEERAAEDSRRAVQVSLLGEVGRNYIEIRGMQRQIQITHQNVEAQAAALEVTRDRYRAGVTTELDVAQAQALLAATRAGLPAQERDLAMAEHGLSVLLAEEPNSVRQELAAAAPIPAASGEAAGVPLGLPSDLLRRRPDIQAAERDVAAATARIGVATADLYPRFMLTGEAGFQSFRTSTLFDSRSLMYSAGPSVSWPIFDRGKIKANIRIQDARQGETLDQYRKTILGALREVEDALIAYDREASRQQDLTAAVDANRRQLGLARRQYQAGTAMFLQVLEAERSLYAAEDMQVQSQRDQTEDLIALYKALGGGWE